MNQTSPADKTTTAPSKIRGKTKQKLIDAGLHLFSIRGFAGVTVCELEDAVGLKPGSGSFYRHFVDKEALLKAIFDLEIVKAKERRTLELEAIGNQSEDIRQALKQQLELTLSNLVINKDSLNLFIREQNQFPELFKVVRAELFEKALSEMIKPYTQRISVGDMVNIDPFHLATVMVSAIFGFHSLASFYGEPLDQKLRDSFIDTLIDLVIA